MTGVMFFFFSFLSFSFFSFFKPSSGHFKNVPVNQKIEKGVVQVIQHVSVSVGYQLFRKKEPGYCYRIAVNLLVI